MSWSWNGPKDGRRESASSSARLDVVGLAGVEVGAGERGPPRRADPSAGPGAAESRGPSLALRGREPAVAVAVEVLVEPPAPSRSRASRKPLPSTAMCRRRKIGRSSPRKIRSCTSSAVGRGRWPSAAWRSTAGPHRPPGRRDASGQGERQAGVAADTAVMPAPPRSASPWGRRSGSAGRRPRCSASSGRCPAPCRRWPGSRARRPGRSSTVMPSALGVADRLAALDPAAGQHRRPGVREVVAAGVAR